MPVWSKRPDPPFAIPEDGDFAKGFLQLTENTLVGAARDGDIEAIKQHIAEGADVNALHFEMPPLTWAVTMGQIEAAELLLQHGADINGRNRDRNTALHLAVFLGRAETAKLLIKNGADVNAKNNDGATPIDLLRSSVGNDAVSVKTVRHKVGTGTGRSRKSQNCENAQGVKSSSEGENTFSVQIRYGMQRPMVTLTW